VTESAGTSKFTKDILLHRGWIGSTKCMFCSKDESVERIFFIVQLLDIYMECGERGFQFGSCAE
jgi:hypothetical protein